MSDDAPAGEPTLADVMALLREQADAIAGVAQRVESLRTGVDESLDAVAQRVGALDEKVDAGLLAVGARFDLIDARQLEAAQAVEALAGMAHTHQRELRELSIRFDRGAARTTARFDRVDAALRQVRGDVAELKADAALLESAVEEVRETVQRHLDDPHPHGNAA